MDGDLIFPHNIIVRHCDRRLMRRDKRTGQFQYSADYSKTYYHFDVSHIRRKNPLYDVKVYIDFVRYKQWSLDNVTLSGKAIFKVFYSTDFLHCFRLIT